MNSKEFNKLKQSVINLTPIQKNKMEKWLMQCEHKPEIVKKLETGNNPCPHCKHEQAYKWGTFKGKQRFRCKSCNKTYNALTGTELNGLHKQEIWEQYCETMLDSKTLRKAADECGISLPTAFNWRHKFLKFGDFLKSKQLEGIVEIDETQIKFSEKGSRNLGSRKPRKRGSDYAEKIKIVIGLDRSGHVTEEVMKYFKLADLKASFLPKLTSELVLCTDGHVNYEYLSRQSKINHKVLNITLGERTKEKVFHIQTVNNYHKRLKQWLSNFNGVATKNLHKYLSWFRWFEMNKKSLQTSTNFINDMVSSQFQH